jgi:hypothetical protein
MSDNLRQLRIWATDPRFPQDYSPDLFRRGLREAADEIERLRAELKKQEPPKATIEDIGPGD